MTRLTIIFSAIASLVFLHTHAYSQSSEANITDISGIPVGEPRTTADAVLQSLGCWKITEISIDDKSRYRLAGRYNIDTLETILRQQNYGPPFDGETPYLFKEIYQCRDNQLILVATDFEEPKRIAAVSLVYCAMDELAGAKPIYDKVGSTTMAYKIVGDLSPEIFYPQKISGDDLQSTTGRLSARFPDTIYATAYKKPGGCIVDFRATGFLFGLTMRSTPVIRDAKKREAKSRQRKIDSMNVAPKL